jgi:hypothetical protein
MIMGRRSAETILDKTLGTKPPGPSMFGHQAVSGISETGGIATCTPWKMELVFTVRRRVRLSEDLAKEVHPGTAPTNVCPTPSPRSGPKVGKNPVDSPFCDNRDQSCIASRELIGD